jgi:hypothetical protein
MESESVSRQPSPLPAPVSAAAGACTLEDDAPEAGDGRDPAPAVLSRLSFCIAWLFGLEAFLSESGSPSHAPRG